MAVFYVLPPRRMLGECLARVLRPLIPGVAISQDACADVIDSLVTGSPDAEDTYVVHREELPEGDDLNEALREGFGAETGDRIVLVSIGPARMNRAFASGGSMPLEQWSVVSGQWTARKGEK